MIVMVSFPTFPLRTRADQSGGICAYLECRASGAERFLQFEEFVFFPSPFFGRLFD